MIGEHLNAADLNRRRHLSCLSAAAAFTLLLLTLHPSLKGAYAQGSGARAQCWSREQLSSRDGEERIRKNMAAAFVAPPRLSLMAVPPAAINRRRVLRRVDLPTDGPKLIALTFDLCEQPNEVAGYQGAVVDYLRENLVRATFFAGGKWMLSHQTRAQQLMTDPLFEIGNHSWGHSNLRLLSGERLRNEIADAGLAYEQVRKALPASCPLAGGDPEALASAAPRQMSLFRFPFGACNKAALEAVDAQGLIPVQWDVSSGDPTPGVSSGRIVNEVIGRVRPGSIVLFHANGRGWKTSMTLPMIVTELRRRGYRFATISELLSAPGARPVYSDSCYDSNIGDTDRYDALSRQLEAVYARFTETYSGTSEKTSPVRQASPPTVTSQGAVYSLDPTDVGTTSVSDVLEVPVPRPATRPLPEDAAAR